MNKHRKRTGRYSRPRGGDNPPPIVVALADIFLAGIILLAFAFFHHVLPALVSELERQQALQNATLPAVTEATAATEPEDGLPPVDAPPSESVETPVVETALPTEPDDRTPWQVRFEGKFTDAVYRDADDYSSPEVSISIESYTVGEGSSQTVYHVADIHIADITNFTAYTADNEIRYFGTQDVMEMTEESGAILAISGDFLTYQKGGFLVRNGEVYKSDSNAASICVLYPDGSMETYDGREYEVADILAKNPLQVWSFGPNLLDENGKAMDSYKVSQAVSYVNPRSAIGYYEPGHYCFVVVDGRQKGYSTGMTIPELAKIFEDLGCTSAYNLDGGGSAVMVFDGQRFSRQSNGGDRGLGDILLIRDSYYGKEGQE